MNNMIASSERQIWPLTGGVHPQENKHQSTSCPIATPPLPETLVLPMSQHAGTAAEPVVAVGDRVLKGQLIAKATGFVSAPLHAPSSGVVTAIENRPIPHASGFSDLCIVLSTDGEDRWCELTKVSDYRQLPPETLVQMVRNAGVSGLGGAGFPTAIKLVPQSATHTLILNGTECEPYITADDMLMREQAGAIIQGAQILLHILGAKTCLIGIEDNKPEAIAALQQAVAGSNIEIVIFPTVYPSGGEKQLIQILTGNEVPSGKLPADLGMVVQNVGTAVAVKEAIVDGKPLISRITTLTGAALTAPQNVQALIGTPAKDLLQHAGLQESELSTLVFGGPMMGFVVERLDIPVIKTSNCLIAGTQEEFPPLPDAQACIRCGHCAEACPSSLLPQQLYWHAKAENHEQLMHHNLFDCIECGACAFVCPSSIPLVQYYRASKGAIRAQEAKHAKSERSKQRYENRLARLEQDKAEKEARRKANAERAARLKAAPSSEEDDPIKAAVARAKANKAAGQARPAELSARQKELKIQLSMAQAQLKKTARALAAAEASGTGDTEQLKSNLAMLKGQVSKLQSEFDDEKSAPPEQQTSPDAQKKQKVELAMARAALKKAERAMAEAIEGNSANTKALQQTVEQCREKLQSLEAAVKPALSDAEKKRKIELAMANAALKKAQRALAEAADGDTQSLQQAVAACQAKVQSLAPEPAKRNTAPLSDASKKLKIEAAMANAAVKKLQRAVASAGAEELATLKQQLVAAEQKAAAMAAALKKSRENGFD